jgi:hypothetical protein
MKPSFSQTRQEIDDLTVNKTLFTLLHRAYPTCVYTIKEGEKPEFEHLEYKEDCAPEMAKLEAELAIYKQELHAELTYREVLADKKASAKTIYDAVKSEYHAAAKKANLPHVANPAAWFRDNCAQVNTHELADACITKLTLVQGKVAEVQAEYQAIEDAKNTCKNYKQTIKDATLQQFAGLTEAKRWEHIFNALKCIAEGK